MVRQVYWSYTLLRLDAATTLTVTVSGKYQKTLLFERNETGRINYFDDYILQTLYNCDSIVLSELISKATYILLSRGYWRKARAGISVIWFCSRRLKHRRNSIKDYQYIYSEINTASSTGSCFYQLAQVISWYMVSNF